ncbi:MAG: hypothetical protein KAR54_02365 [Candidatus Pacebacteria bacterium]|nr:hypothetical protein [Candidatus Paceibacterota bacterium]
MFNKYETYARIFPAILTIIPIFIFSHFYLYTKIPEILDVIFVKITGSISIILVLIYFISQISRYISKMLLQDNVFQNELHFPTTNYLLYSDKQYSKEMKEKIRSKIKIEFGLILSTPNEEKSSEVEARKRIKEAVGLIRNKVKNGHLLLQHNIEYGFVRNLIGGTIISIPFSFFNIIFFTLQKNMIIVIISILLLVFYLTLFIIKKNILIYFGNNYASVLFNEYLS